MHHKAHLVYLGLLALGIILFGLFSGLIMLMNLDLSRAGEKANWTGADLGISVRYLKLCKSKGWSPWPAYLLIPALIAGVVLLATGVALIGMGN
jgi:hypothetical protein